MNLITLFLYCARALLLSWMAVGAWAAINWDQPVPFLYWRGAVLAGFAGSAWLVLFLFALDPTIGVGQPRQMWDALLSVGILAVTVYYWRRRIV